MEVTRHINYDHLAPADTSLAIKMLGRAAIMGLKFDAVGSRSIDKASHFLSDLDYLVFDKQVEGHTFAYWLKRNSFEVGGSEPMGNDFTSYKKGKVNFIVTQSEEFYKKFLTANIICQVHKITNKEDRIAIFNHIRGEGSTSAYKEKYDYILANGSSKGYTEAFPF